MWACVSQRALEPGQSLLGRAAQERQLVEVSVQIGQGTLECRGGDIVMRGRLAGKWNDSHVTITVRGDARVPWELRTGIRRYLRGRSCRPSCRSDGLTLGSHWARADDEAKRRRQEPRSATQLVLS